MDLALVVETTFKLDRFEALKSFVDGSKIDRMVFKKSMGMLNLSAKIRPNGL